MNDRFSQSDLVPREIKDQIKVLFVDDDAAVLESYCKYFQKQGFEARGTGTAAEAIEEYSEWLPDVVVVDIHLPDSSGLSLLGRLSRVGAKVIVLTRDNSTENIITAMNRNAREFLVKPIDMAQLQQAIQLTA